MSGWEWTPTDTSDIPSLAKGGGTWPPTLTEFLLARIADDEANPRLVGFELRVLAECEAKRRIVVLYDQLGGGTVDQPMATALKVACMSLATIWADHPDFDESWRP